MVFVTKDPVFVIQDSRELIVDEVLDVQQIVQTMEFVKMVDATAILDSRELTVLIQNFAFTTALIAVFATTGSVSAMLVTQESTARKLLPVHTIAPSEEYA